MANPPAPKTLEKKVADLESKVKQLQDVEKRFLAFLDNLDCEAFMKDEKHQFVFMNKHMRNEYGKNDFMGKPTHKLAPKKLADQILEEDKRVFAGQTVDALHTRKDKDGTEKVYRVVKFPFVQDGKVTLIGGISQDITEYSDKNMSLARSNEKLSMNKMMLEESNTALRVLLKKRDEDRVETEEKVLYNVKELIKPYIIKLKDTGLSPLQQALLSVIELNIDDIISPFVRDMSLKFMKLTPMEIQVANLIKQGKTTKQIAELMNLSGRTIETHRKKIRTKIGIGNKKANLRSHLLSLQ